MSVILIVSAVAEIAAVLDVPLREAGHDSFPVASAGDALGALRARSAELVLVDLELPDSAGAALCREVRADPTTAQLPIVAITRDAAEMERVAALELGVDDLVTKPFSVRELVLRVLAVLRRCRSSRAPSPGSPLRVGSLALDMNAHHAFVSGEEIAVTPLEFRLLARLMAHVGRVHSREELFANVWNAAPTMKTRTVDSHLKRLRRKLAAASDLLQSVRGVGYRLAAPAQLETSATQRGRLERARRTPPRHALLADALQTRRVARRYLPARFLSPEVNG